METHEHLLSDEDLPGHGVLDSEFARNMIRQQEESGMIVWDEEAEKYEPSARMVMGAVSMGIVQKAAEIDPRASQEEVTAAILSCIPWITAATEITPSDIPFEPGEMPDFHAAEPIADTFPADWLDEER